MFTSEPVLLIPFLSFQCTHTEKAAIKVNGGKNRAKKR